MRIGINQESQVLRHTDTDIHVFAERAMMFRDQAILHCRRRHPAFVKDATWAGATSEFAEEIIRECLSPLQRSEIVIWKKDPFSLAMSGVLEFVGTTVPEARASFDYRPQLWLFGGTFYPGFTNQYQLLELPENADLDAILITPASPEMFVLLFIYGGQDGEVFLRHLAMPVGSKAMTWHAFILAGRAFMRQRLASRESVPLPRALRRRMQREGKEIPEIRIVQLRERECGKGRQLETHSQRYHRWIRRWSWRRLPQPLKKDSPNGGRKGDEVVFVRSHICGPKGASLLTPRESIYAVSR